MQNVVTRILTKPFNNPEEVLKTDAVIELIKDVSISDRMVLKVHLQRESVCVCESEEKREGERKNKNKKTTNTQQSILIR